MERGPIAPARGPRLSGRVYPPSLKYLNTFNTRLVAVQHGPHDATEGAGRAALVQRRLDPYHVVQSACGGGEGGGKGCAPVRSPMRRGSMHSCDSRRTPSERPKCKVSISVLTSRAQLLDHKLAVRRGVDAVQGHDVGVAGQVRRDGDVVVQAAQRSRALARLEQRSRVDGLPRVLPLRARVDAAEHGAAGAAAQRRPGRVQRAHALRAGGGGRGDRAKSSGRNRDHEEQERYVQNQHLDEFNIDMEMTGVRLSHRYAHT